MGGNEYHNVRVKKVLSEENTVKTKLMGVTVAAIVSALISSMVVAQNLEEITVQGTRVLDIKDAGRSNTGLPIRDVSLTYGVNIADLDLATQYGPIALEKRVKDAAMAACEELGQKYPQSTPSNGECAKAAADKAMVKARELVAKARQKLPHDE
jgi:UrcA family protein